jgi:hypothetical protein
MVSALALPEKTEEPSFELPCFEFEMRLVFMPELLSIDWFSDSDWCWSLSSLSES